MINKFFIKKNIYMIFGLVTLFIVGLLLYKNFFSIPTYQTAEVKKTNIVKTITASGEIKSDEEVELSFPVSGKLVNLSVKKNDPVKKGAYLGSLDKRQLQMQVESALRDYSKTRWDFDEANKETYKDTIITDTIRRVLDKYQFDLDKAVLDVEIANFAKNNADLYSPINGVVTDVYTHEGMSVIGGVTPILTVANPEKMFFIAKIVETNIAEITVSQDVVVTLDAFEEKQIKGKVIEIDHAATISPNEGIKYYEVKVFLDDLNRVKLDMSGDVKVVTASRSDVLTIPSIAIQKKNDKKIVEVLDGKQIIQKQISTGIRGDGGVIEILSGLNEGEKVIISGIKN